MCLWTTLPNQTIGGNQDNNLYCHSFQVSDTDCSSIPSEDIEIKYISQFGFIRIINQSEHILKGALSIYDTSGKLILSQMVDNRYGATSAELTAITGVYFVVFRTKLNQYSARVFHPNTK